MKQLFYFAAFIFFSADDNRKLKGCEKMHFLSTSGMIALFFSALVAIFLLTNIYMEVTYKYSEKTRFCTIQIKALFGLIRYQKKFPAGKSGRPDEKLRTGGEHKDLNKDGLESLEQVEVFLNYFVDFYRTIKKHVKKIRIPVLEWKSTIGTGHAASSAVAAGAGWALKGNVIGMISYYFTIVNTPVLEITPVFNRAVSETYFRCMFQVRAGYAILAGISLFKFWYTRMRPSSDAAVNHSENQTL